MLFSAQLSLRYYNPENLDGRARRNGCVTLATFYRDVVVPSHVSGLDPKSATKYEAALRIWNLTVGDLPIAEAATRKKVDLFYVALLNAPGRARATLADETRKRHLAYIKKIMAFAVEEDVIDRLPRFPRVRVDKDQRIPKQWFTLDEVEALLIEPGPCDCKRRLRRPPPGRRYTTGDFWRALVYCTYWTAASIGEMLAMEGRHLHLADEVLDIPIKKRRRRRSVVLDARAMAYLRRIRVERCGPTDRIFAGLGREPNMGNHLKRLCQAAGIELAPYCRWHSLRRTRAEEKFKTRGLAWARDQLGHTDHATTVEHYLREVVIRGESIEQQRADLHGHADLQLRFWEANGNHG